MAHSYKFVVFGWEIRIQHTSLTQLHTTQFPEKENLKEELDLNGGVGYKYYNIEADNLEKRIFVMTKDKGMLDYIFRDLGIALLTYHEDAVMILNGVMTSLSSIRNDLWNRNATPRELDIFDNKVLKNYCGMLEVIRKKAEDPNNELKERDNWMYRIIKCYDIKNYYVRNTYMCNIL